MNNNKTKNNAVRQLIDARLSGMQENPNLEKDVLEQVRGEIKVKKKISVSLVLIIAIVLISITALAAITLNAFHQKTIEMEAINGLFSTWTTDDKVSFVGMMVDAGLNVDPLEVAKLHDTAITEEEKNRIASELVIGCFGPGRGGDLTLYDIMALEYGPYETWSIDVKAQVTAELLKHGDLGSLYAMDVLPVEQEISQEQAVQIAYDTLTSKYAITKAELLSKRMDVYYREIPYGTEQTLHRLWQIRFRPDDGDQEYTVDINSDGAVLASSEPVAEKSHTLMDRFNTMIWTEAFWTPESLAAFAHDWPQLIDEATRNGEEIRGLAKALLTIPYQFPDEKSVPQETAQEIAKNAVLKTPAWTQERLDLYKKSTSYRVYTSGKPEWRISYVIARYEDYDKFHAGEIPLGIVVLLDARTGEVLSVKETKDLGLYNDFREFPDDRDTVKEQGVG